MSERAIVPQNGQQLAGVATPMMQIASQNIDLFALGRAFAQSGYFQDAKQEAQAVVKILYGQELGISPVSAMMGVHIISGRPCPSANLIATLIKRSGRYDYRIKRLDNTGCVLGLLQRNGAEWETLGEISFVEADAKQAGLLTGANKHNWNNYPRNMYFARTISNSARFYFADLFGGGPVYVPEEMGALVDGEGNVVPAQVNRTTGEVLDVREELAERNRQQEQAPEAPAVSASPADHAQTTAACITALGWKGAKKRLFEDVLGRQLTDLKSLSEADKQEVAERLMLTITSQKAAFAAYGGKANATKLQEMGYAQLLGDDPRCRETRLARFAEILELPHLETSGDILPSEWATLATKLNDYCRTLRAEQSAPAPASAVIVPEIVGEDPFQDE